MGKIGQLFENASLCLVPSALVCLRYLAVILFGIVYNIVSIQFR